MIPCTFPSCWLNSREHRLPIRCLKFVYILGVIALVIVVPFLLGTVIARAVRMRGYEFKIGLILASLDIWRCWSCLAPGTSKQGKFTIPLGVDLKGGVILIYEIDTSSASGTRQGGKRRTTGRTSTWATWCRR